MPYPAKPPVVLVCVCGKSFEREQKAVDAAARHGRTLACSASCSARSERPNRRRRLDLICGCGKHFERTPCQLRRSQSKGWSVYCAIDCAQRVDPAYVDWDLVEKLEYNYVSNDDLRPFRKYLSMARARWKNKTCSLSIYDLVDQWEEQQGICPYTGWKLDHYETSNSRKPRLDRIECSVGYEKGNIQFVAHISNLAKNNFSDAELIDFCEAVVGYRRTA